MKSAQAAVAADSAVAVEVVAAVAAAEADTIEAVVEVVAAVAVGTIHVKLDFRGSGRQMRAALLFSASVDERTAY